MTATMTTTAILREDGVANAEKRKKKKGPCGALAAFAMLAVGLLVVTALTRGS